MAHKGKKRSLRILVVDDDELLRGTIEEILLSKGYRVKTAKDAITALERLQIEPFDMVLTDLNMPGMSGLELVEKIYSENMNVTPILMSSLFSGEIKSYAFQKGAYANLVKPFSVNSLFTVIENSRRNKKGEVRQL